MRQENFQRLMPRFRSGKAWLEGLAWVNVFVHVSGLVLALVGMRPGSPLVDLESRVRYLETVPAAWVLGWATWMLCTCALIALFAVLAGELPDIPSARLALSMAVAGGTLDIFCDAIYIGVLPRVAAILDPGYVTFLAFERMANLGGLVVANGMYSFGVLLLTESLRRHVGRAMAVVVSGYGTFGFGIVLVVAGFLDAPLLAELATGPTIVLYCIWTLAVARAMKRTEAQL